MTVSQISSLVEDEAAAGYDLAPSWVEVFPLLLLLLCLASPPPQTSSPWFHPCLAQVVSIPPPDHKGGTPNSLPSAKRIRTEPLQG